MATATVPANQSRVFRRVLSRLVAETTVMPSTPANAVGNRGVGYITGRCWVCAGVPSSTAPTSMNNGDLILDTTNNDVYRYDSGTTYTMISTSL